MAKATNSDDHQKVLMEYLSCRPVAYLPILARRVGGVKAGVMLSQLLYWSKDKHVQERGGWIYKSVAEMEEETGLTKTEQQTARLTLAEFGVVESVLRGMPRVWYYRVDISALYQLLNVTIIGKESHPMGKSFNGKVIQHWEGYSSNIGKDSHPTLDDFPSQLNRNQRLHTEITSETTTETTSSSYPLQDESQEEEVPEETGLSAAVVSELKEIGIFDNLITEIEQSDWTEEEISDLVQKVKTDPAVTSQAGAFIHRFRNGQKPKSKTKDPRSYITGPYSEFINH